VLFADVSGFTPLTDALVQGGAEGPEELTRLLNAYFGQMIALVEEQGGEIVRFGGDSVTALFVATDEPLSYATRRARQAAESMQAAAAGFADFRTSVGPVTLETKVGIGAGEVLSMQVGGVSGRWEYVVTGDSLRQAAEAENRALPGEVALSPQAAALVSPAFLSPRPAAEPDWSVLRDPAAIVTYLRRFVPAVVLGWLDEGLQEWLAVLRPMTVLFAGMADLHHEQRDIVSRLQNALRSAQDVVYQHLGIVSRVTVDDTGTVLLVLFAHQGTTTQAVRCALALQESIPERETGLAIGVATGHVFAGPVGGETRREYTVMGDAINLASRLMDRARAGGGGVLCDYGTYDQARRWISFESLSPIRVKGKAGLIRVYRPGRDDKAHGTRRALVGRESEAARLDSALDAVGHGQSGILIIEGETGIGKSRLVTELTRMVTERGMTTLLGSGRRIEQHTPYRAWRDIFGAFFGIGDAADQVERQRLVQRVVRELASDRVPHVTLLDDLLGLGMDDTQLTASMSPEVRRQNLAALLQDLLRAWAAERPLILILEDAQWLDDLSWELVVRIGRSLPDWHQPVLLVVAYRSSGEHRATRQHIETLQSVPCAETISLAALGAQETVALVTERLGLSADNLPEDIASLVSRQSQGNPFFAEELVLALRDRGMVRDGALLGAPGNEGSVRQATSSAGGGALDLSLPDTLQGLVLSRIDLLSPERQFTLKVASVIGRAFSYAVLHHVLRQYTRISDRTLRHHLETLLAYDLVYAQDELGLTFAFRQSVTQEVAYQTLLFAQRRMLHRAVANALETLYPDRIGEQLGLLAYHWERAGEPEKAVPYLLRAAERARQVYANEMAVSYLERALALLDSGDASVTWKTWRLEALRGLGQTYHGMSMNREAQECLQEAVSLVPDVELTVREQIRLYHWLGEVLWWQDRPDEQIRIGQEGLALLGDDAETTEAALMNQTVAMGYVRKGDGERSRSYTFRTAQFADRLPYEEELRPAFVHITVAYRDVKDGENAQRWLALLEERASRCHDMRALAEARFLTGDILLRQGDLQGAVSSQQRALELYDEIADDKFRSWCLDGIVTALLSLGDLGSAEEYAHKGLETAKRVDSARDLAWAHWLYGQVSFCLGNWDQAMRSLEQAAPLCQEIDCRWSEPWIVADVGWLYLSWADRERARDSFCRAVSLAGAEGLRRYPRRFAGIMSGLEAAIDDPDAYRDLCARVRPDHPDMDKDQFVQWFLERAEIEAGHGPLLYDGPIGESCPGWVWQNPFGDCSHAVHERVDVRAANGRDLWDLNQSAPRLLRQVVGDFAAQTECMALSSQSPAVGGLLLWENESSYLTLTWGLQGRRDISFGGCVNGKDVLVGRGRLPSISGEAGLERVHLRLERRGDRVRAFCSADGLEWFTVGDVSVPVAESAQVGVHAVGNIDRLIYGGAHPAGTAIQFGPFQLWGR
jgi:class 3 adenylate cyclase/tetratricopeptide (TPR) repeat protein